MSLERSRLRKVSSDNEQPTRTLTEIILPKVTTAIEAFSGGLVAGLTKQGVTAVSSHVQLDRVSSGFIEVIAPAALGGATFALLGTAFRIWLGYLDKQKINPELTLAEHLKNSESDAKEFATKLWFVGGGSFAVFTSWTNVAALALESVLTSSLNILVGGLATAGGALALFALLRAMTGLNLPVEKLYDIGAVFVGFAVGAFTVAKIAASVSLSPAQLFSISVLVPAAAAAALAFTARVGLDGAKYCLFFNSLGSVPGRVVNAITSSKNEEDPKLVLKYDDEESPKSRCCS